MDFHLIIAVNIMAMTVVIVANTLRFRMRGYRPWLAVNSLVASVSGLGLWFAPDAAGWIAAAAFVPLIVVPICLNLMAGWLIERKYDRAATMAARLVTWFFPANDARFNFSLGTALAATGPDQIVAALHALEPAATPEQRALIQTYLAAETDDWAAALVAARSLPQPLAEQKGTEIRALAELGRIDEMAQVYESGKGQLFSVHLHVAQMLMLAFTGRTAGLQRVLDGPLKGLEGEIKAYWTTLARVIASPGDTAHRRDLEHLAATATRERSRRAASRHLGFADTRPPLSAATHEIALALEQRVLHDATARLRPLRQCAATLALLAVNVAVFALEEWYGSSMKSQTLLDLGALWPPYLVDRGEWWRLLTAAFLHFGWLHLALNMLMLWQLGRQVETVFGSARMLTAYLCCAVASSAAVAALMLTETIEMNPLVGASGAIFGLFGIETVRLVSRWLVSRDVLDRGRLMPLALILLLQAGVDYSIPNSSFSAHASGFLAGIAAGVILLALSRNVSAPPAEPAA
jgi:rhomboid protease GluP